MAHLVGAIFLAVRIPNCRHSLVAQLINQNRLLATLEPKLDADGVTVGLVAVLRYFQVGVALQFQASRLCEITVNNNLQGCINSASGTVNSLESLVSYVLSNPKWRAHLEVFGAMHNVIRARIFGSDSFRSSVEDV